MEVIMPPLNPTDFNFNFNSSTYPTAPSTPRLIAPTSPSSLSELYREFDQLLIMDDDDTHSRATVPFAWEEKPGVPKPTTNLLEQDFAFDVSSQILSSVRSAEHLFHHGMIKPVEIIEINKERDLRGRERINSSSRSRRTRSLPPLIRDSEQQQRRQQQQEPDTKPTMFGSGKGSKKWSFKDLFLFRSASDGRALDRDPLKKYSDEALNMKVAELVTEVQSVNGQSIQEN
ncbi:hypothetical protein L1987_51583 [Smallanthus sonchifolius]|uniref:Uncharacterized protein n=1 Tax=Smallanthus sonchifolius TaxID=185202 RepID=A0ACB9ERV3_9ASTR|nr:hypothetical protein L1987_51583 [Smallanthus sonchifolius]